MAKTTKTHDIPLAIRSAVGYGDKVMAHLGGLTTSQTIYMLELVAVLSFVEKLANLTQILRRIKIYLRIPFQSFQAVLFRD